MSDTATDFAIAAAAPKDAVACEKSSCVTHFFQTPAERMKMNGMMGMR